MTPLHSEIREDVRRVAGAERRLLLFISKHLAYASFAQPNDEHSPTGKLSNPDIEEVTDDTYGPMEGLVRAIFGGSVHGRVSIVRPGYIVGPLDPTDRFTYWPVRASRG